MTLTRCELCGRIAVVLKTLMIPSATIAFLRLSGRRVMVLWHGMSEQAPGVAQRVWCWRWHRYLTAGWR